MQTLLQVQQHMTVTMPLLMDEKVHYSVAKFMYSASHQHVDARQWLKSVPLIFGCWHPYKHCLTLLYRAMLPIIAALEVREVPLVGSHINIGRKVIFMEKLVACLLMLRDSMTPEVQHAMTTVRTPADLSYYSNCTLKKREKMFAFVPVVLSKLYRSYKNITFKFRRIEHQPTSVVFM